MRRLIRNACFTAALGGATLLRGWTVGNGLLNLQADTAFNYTSNLESRNGGSAASFVNFGPTLLYERTAAILRTSATAGVSLERRTSGRVPANTLFQGSLNVASERTIWPSLSLRGRVSYSEGFADDLNVNARVLSRNTDLNLGTDWGFGSRGKASFTTDYRIADSAIFNRQASWNTSTALSVTLPRDRSVFTQFSLLQTTSTPERGSGPGLDQQQWIYELGVAQSFASGAKASLSAGYFELHRSAQETRDAMTGRSGPTAKAVFEGPFLPPTRFPKMTSRLSLSYGYGQQPGLNDTGSPQLSGEVTVGWNARPFTRLELSALRSRSLTVEALTAENTSATATVTQGIGARTSIAAYVGHQWLTIRGNYRQTEALVGGLSADRRLGSRDRWFARMGYTFREATSTEDVSTFSQHNARVSLGYRY